MRPLALTFVLSLGVLTACGEPETRSTTELALEAAASTEYAAWQTARRARDVAKREAGEEAIANRRRSVTAAEEALAEATAKRDAILAASPAPEERDAARREWEAARDAALALWEAAGTPPVLAYEAAEEAEARAMERLAAAAPDAWIEFVATTDFWLEDVDTSAMPGLLAVLDDDSFDRVTAMLQDEQDPTWRERAASGELTDDPEALEFWRRLARLDVTSPLSDAEQAYLEHSRNQTAAFNQELSSNNAKESPEFASWQAALRFRSASLESLRAAVPTETRLYEEAETGFARAVDALLVAAPLETSRWSQASLLTGYGRATSEILKRAAPQEWADFTLALQARHETSEALRAVAPPEELLLHGQATAGVVFAARAFIRAYPDRLADLVAGLAEQAPVEVEGAPC